MTLAEDGQWFRVTEYQFVGKRPAVAWRVEAVFVPDDKAGDDHV